MIYVTPGQRLSCTTGSAAAPRKRSCHLTRKNSPTSPQNCRVRGVIESISLPRQGNIPNRTGLGGKGVLSLPGTVSPPHQARKLWVMSAPPAEGGRGLWKTHPARRTGVSGNLEAAEKAETWRASPCGLGSGAEWGNAEPRARLGCEPQGQAGSRGRGSPSAGTKAPPLPSQSDFPLPHPLRGRAAGGGQVRPAPPTRFSSPRRRARRATASSRSRNFASLMETEPRASSLLPRPPRPN